MSNYSPSIMQDEEYCFLCGATVGKLDRHEPFGGAYRSKSKRLGLWCYLCHDTCHLGGAHKNAKIARELRQRAQRIAMWRYHWTTGDFIREFGKNYL